MRKTQKQILRAEEYQYNKEKNLKDAHKYYSQNKKWLQLLSSQWKWNNPKRVQAHYQTQKKRRIQLRKDPKWRKKQEQYRIRSRQKLGR